MPILMLPLEQTSGVVRLGGLPPRTPRVTLVTLLEQEASRLAAEPDALPSALYSRLALNGWDAERIASALKFGTTPWLRFATGIPPPGRHVATATGRHRSRILGAIMIAGERFCSWSDDGQVNCWELSSGQMAWWLGTHAELAAATVTPDHTFLLTASGDGQVAAWDLRASATLLWEAPATGARVTRLVADTSAPRAFAAFADGSVCTFEVLTGRMSQIAEPGPPVRHVAQVAAGTIVTGGDAGDLIWYDASSGQRHREPAAHAAPIVSLEVDGDRLTSASEDGGIRWWRASDGQSLGQHQGAFGLHGARWIGGLHDCLVLWGRDGTVSTVRGTKENVVTVHRGEVTDVRVVQPRDRRSNRVRRGKPLVVSCSADGTVEIRQYDSMAVFDTLDVHDAPVLGCTESPLTGEIIAWDDEGRLAGWVPGGSRRPRLFGEATERPDVRLHFSVSPRSLVVSTDRELSCHDLGSSGLSRRQNLVVRRARWPRTLIVDEHLGLVDERSVETKMRERATRQRLPWKVLSPDSVRAFERFASALDLKGVDGVAIGLDRKRRWVAVTWTREGLISMRTEGDKRFRGLAGHRSRISDAAWVTSDRLATASWDGTLRWLSIDRQTEWVLEGHVGRVLGCTALDHETLLSWGDDHTIRAWQPEGRRPLAATLELNDRPTAVAVLADERLVVGTRRGHLVVVNRTLSAHSNPVKAHVRGVVGLAPITIHSDAVGVVSCGGDGRVRVWRIGSDHVPVHEDVAVGEAPFAQVLPLGKRANAVALLDEVGAVWVYDAGPPPWLENPREVALRAKGR